MKKIIKWTGILLGVFIGVLILAGVALYPAGMKKLTRTYPDIQVQAIDIPTGPEAIVHGEHIAIVWGCTKCHRLTGWKAAQSIDERLPQDG